MIYSRGQKKAGQLVPFKQGVFLSHCVSAFALKYVTNMLSDELIMPQLEKKDCTIKQKIRQIEHLHNLLFASTILCRISRVH